MYTAVRSAAPGSSISNPTRSSVVTLPHDKSRNQPELDCRIRIIAKRKGNSAVTARYDKFAFGVCNAAQRFPLLGSVDSVVDQNELLRSSQHPGRSYRWNQQEFVHIWVLTASPATATRRQAVLDDCWLRYLWQSHFDSYLGSARVVAHKQPLSNQLRRI